MDFKTKKMEKHWNELAKTLHGCYKQSVSRSPNILLREVSEFFNVCKLFKKLVFIHLYQSELARFYWISYVIDILVQ